jgi:two-component system sensor histidine kinase DctS
MNTGPSPTAPPLPGAFSAAFTPRARRSWIWALPFSLALVLVAMVAAWLQIGDVQEAEEKWLTLISDTLSLEEKLRVQLATDNQRVQDLAQAIADGHLTPDKLGARGDVITGLRQRWQSITWIDAQGRIVKQLPETSGPGLASNAAAHEDERRGLSGHLEGSIPRNGGQLIVRYSLHAFLAEHTPWWFAQRYVVRLVDSFEEVLANAGQTYEAARGESHRISFDPPIRGVYLELQMRERQTPWYRSTQLLLIAAVLVMLAWASWLLRSQVRGVEQAEAAWRGEALWRQAMEDALTVGLRARDLQGRLIYANPRFVELTGYPIADLIGKLPPMPYWPPDAMEETFDRFRRNMSGGAPRGGYEARWRRKDAREIDVMVFEAPLIDARGEQVGWMGSVIDITELKRVNEQARLHADRMAHQSRLMTMGEIASSLAHELNQPLTAITSYNAGLRNALQAMPDMDERLLVALDKQGEQAAHAGRIVHRIREFLSRRAPRQEGCSLQEIVDHAIELLRSDLRRLNIALRVEHEDQANIEVLADPVLIEQVVINLLRNAADALLGASQAAPEIVVRTSRDRDESGAPRCACIVVRDNGDGLAGHSIEQLTTPFFSTKSEGMGLGLAICRSIVESHRGQLAASDVELPYTGAVFTVILPLPHQEDAVSHDT